MDIDVRETTGSGSGEAAHPSLSLHIRTICMGAFKRVILSMQSRCHAVSVCYTSVETANVLPHKLVNTYAHSVYLMERHIYLKYGPWHYPLQHYVGNLGEGETRGRFQHVGYSNILIMHLKCSFNAILILSSFRGVKDARLLFAVF